MARRLKGACHGLAAVLVPRRRGLCPSLQPAHASRWRHRAGLLAADGAVQRGRHECPREGWSALLAPLQQTTARNEEVVSQLAEHAPPPLDKSGKHASMQHLVRCFCSTTRARQAKHLKLVGVLACPPPRPGTRVSRNGNDTHAGAQWRVVLPPPGSPGPPSSQRGGQGAVVLHAAKGAVRQPLPARLPGLLPVRRRHTEQHAAVRARRRRRVQVGAEAFVPGAALAKATSTASVAATAIASSALARSVTVASPTASSPAAATATATTKPATISAAAASVATATVASFAGPKATGAVATATDASSARNAIAAHAAATTRRLVERRPHGPNHARRGGAGGSAVELAPQDCKGGSPAGGRRRPGDGGAAAARAGGPRVLRSAEQAYRSALPCRQGRARRGHEPWPGSANLVWAPCAANLVWPARTE